MVTLDRVIGAIGLLCLFVYLASYGAWTWKDKNKLGAIAVFMLSLFMILIPVYLVLFGLR